MIACGLTESEMALMRRVFDEQEDLREVILFGSRAKGTHRPESDIDLALVGVTASRDAQSIEEALDELPLPYRFDVRALSSIGHAPLLEHIERVGVPIYHRQS